MEGLLILVAVYGGIWLFATIGRAMTAAAERRDEETKNRALTDVFEKLQTDPQTLMQSSRDKLHKIDSGQTFTDIDAQEQRLYMMYRGKHRHQELEEKCSVCHKGFLRVKDGKYGKFLGCSNFPACKNTVSIDKAKWQYKNDINNDFKEDFIKAYSK